MRVALIRDIRQFIDRAPLELSARICAVLQRCIGWPQVSAELPSMVFEADLKELLLRIVSACQAQNIRPSEILLAFEASSAIEAHHRNEPRLELIWSGPTASPFSMRRTDETLLQLIEAAYSSLTLVSFALYRIDRLTQALREAIFRGVRIRMFIETHKTNEPNLRDLYGEDLANSIQFFSWTDARRLQSTRGDHGVLHAKAAVADRDKLFISSANLTEYALTLNMEMGILIHGGELPQRAERIFSDYIAHGIFTKLQVGIE